ncbi:activator of 90 kDa heat shock protein ATPase homolog 1-like [Babylonia areolata]|uniref:activator of 90 kDa heat shock protein ATPase homolog 1-like n=1 Tax=Babylonia areolata TaxID=304850 RepID=UPI003FD4A609
MAKWGEGDPRWIVEERPDATNVNNWHWTEKDATDWSKNKFKELFIGLKIESDEGSCEIKDLSKIEGEASVTNRRGKLAFFYDWVLVGNWQGKVTDGQKSIKGKFEIPNLGEEHDTNEITVGISIDKDTDEARAIKEMMRKTGVNCILEQVEKYVTLLKQEYSQGIILPSKSAAQAQSNNKENVVKREMNKVVETTPSSSKQTSNNVGVKIPTNTVTMKETFRCTPDIVYGALTSQEMMRLYTGESSVVEAAPGGRFVLMGGNVLGEFTELVPSSKVCMRWRMKSWPDEHYSVVTIELEQKQDSTVLSMKQVGVPQRELDRTQEGWKVNFWERMKMVFRIGSTI